MEIWTIQCHFCQKQELQKVEYAQAMWYDLKLSILLVQSTEAGLILKWDRISSAVQWCYQKQSNCTVGQRAMSPKISYNIHGICYRHTHIHNHDKETHRARLPLLEIPNFGLWSNLLTCSSSILGKWMYINYLDTHGSVQIWHI